MQEGNNPEDRARRLRSLSRRGFLAATSAGTAGVALMSGAGGLTLGTDAEDVSSGDIPAAVGAAPVVAQVRDMATGELSIMSGMREVIVRDPQLVMRLVRSLAP